MKRSAASGIPIMLLAMAIVPCMDAIAKHLAELGYPVLQITWARSFFHFALLLPLLFWRHRLRELWPRQIGLQLIRGGLLTAASFLFFSGVARMPIADTLALTFVSPLVVTALSPFLLGEKVGPRRLAAVAVGFLGAVVILRPGFGVFQPAALFGLGCGCVYALYALLTRKLAGTAPPLVTLAYTALLGTIALSPLMPTVWVAPDLQAWGWMAGIGLVAAVGHFLVILAYEHTEASLLSPFGYTEIVWAVMLGWVFFGDFPDRITWIGIAILIASGVYIALRERRLGVAAKSAPNPAG